MEVVRLYATQSGPFDPQVLRDVASSAIVRGHPSGLWRVQWPDLKITISRLAPSEVDRHLQELLAWLNARGAKDSVIARLRWAKEVFELEIEPGLDEQGRWEDVAGGLALMTRSWIGLDHTFLDHTGRVQFRPPRGQGEQVLREPPDPPSAMAVLLRALALATVVHRASLELADDRASAQDDWRFLMGWIDDERLWHAFEDSELSLVRAAVGSLDREALVDASWRSEGLGVLLWALQLAELPAHDTMVDVYQLYAALGFLGPGAADALPELRPRAAIEACHRRLLGLHWRIRDFQQSPRPMDFVRFSRDCWFGSFDLSGVPLVDNDLALAGTAIIRSTHSVFQRAASIALERHQAVAWLVYGGSYAEVDTST